ncbi:MAG: hypothetical protein KGZ79_00135 [Dethiobacter sp.]|jgi:Tfp pilus assembly protein PilO|nr:hypothetical protein [Dethiobacter sp.]
MKVKKKKNLAVFLLVLLVLLGCLTYWFELGPSRGRIAALRRENSILAGQVERDGMLAARLEEEREELSAWKVAGELIRIILPPLSELPLLLERVEERLRFPGSGLEILQIEKVAYDNERGLAVVPLHFKVSTTPEEYMALIKDLEDSLNILQLNAVNYSFTGNQIDGLIFLKIILSWDEYL